MVQVRRRARPWNRRWMRKRERERERKREGERERKREREREREGGNEKSRGGTKWSEMVKPADHVAKKRLREAGEGYKIKMQ